MRSCVKMPKLLHRRMACIGREERGAPVLKKQYLKYKELLHRRVKMIPQRLYVFGLLLCCLAVTQLWLHKQMHFVYVTDSAGTSHLMTTQSTDPEELLELAGLTIETGDQVSYVNYAENLSNLNVQRAFPVTIQADGETYEGRVTSGTVQEVLEQVGVPLNEHDFTVPSLHADVQKDDVIQVNRVEYVDSVEYEEIPFETEYSYTSEFYKKRRKTVVRQKGQNGKLAITSRERWVNGELASSQVIANEIVRHPKNEIIRAYKAGAPVSPMLGPDGTTAPPSSYKAVYQGRATGYHSRRGGRGASRLGLHYGTVAVNPAKIPYGSLLYIASPDGRFVYGYAIATDTGTALQEGHALVDLYYETSEEAILNGVQAVNVYVVK